jgi:hypothetical protein
MNTFQIYSYNQYLYCRINNWSTQEGAYRIPLEKSQRSNRIHQVDRQETLPDDDVRSAFFLCEGLGAYRPGADPWNRCGGIHTVSGGKGSFEGRRSGQT